MDVRPGDHTVVRLPADAPVPPGLLDVPGFVSVTRTPDELSIVCPTEHAPESADTQSGWRLLTVRGPLGSPSPASWPPCPGSWPPPV